MKRDKNNNQNENENGFTMPSKRRSDYSVRNVSTDSADSAKPAGEASENGALQETAATGQDDLSNQYIDDFIGGTQTETNAGSDTNTAYGSYGNASQNQGNSFYNNAAQNQNYGGYNNSTQNQSYGGYNAAQNQNYENQNTYGNTQNGGNGNVNGAAYYSGVYVQDEYKPISPWGYIGYNILFALPIVCWVFLFMFAFGKEQNINLRNYARSILLVYLIAIIIGFIAFCAGLISAFFSMR